MKLVLASQSAARAQLLRAGGYRFKQMASDLREKPHPRHMPFESWLIKLATQKARAVARRYSDAIVIGCDTGIFFEGKALGKAGTVQQAVRMLARLSGKTHRISTGMCVLSPGAGPLPRRQWTGVETARVTFRALSRRDIVRYVKAIRPLACAGAYALQGGGAAIIRRIDGDPTAVVGLPMGLLRTLLAKCGYQPKA